MKTINNVQKTILTAAFIFSGLFITGIASANNNDSMSNSDVLKNIQVESAVDNQMTIENWMFSDTYFSAKSLIEEASDIPMEAESWMFDENNFSSLSEAFVPVAENGLEIEGWMTDESNFSQNPDDREITKKVEVWDVKPQMYGKRLFILTQVKDEEMGIESWMLRNYYWK